MRSLYSDYTPETDEGQFFHSIKGEIDELYDAFTNTLTSATETFQWIGARNISEGEDGTKKSARSKNGLATRKKTVYNEFASEAMNWANRANRQSGDAAIIYDGKRKKFVLVEALEEGYFEVATGTYKRVSAFYEQTYGRAVDEVYGNTESAESAEGADIWDMQFPKDGRNDDGDDSALEGKGLQTDTSRDDEHLRGGNQGELVKKSSRIDSKGRELTKAQQEFFKDSKVRDAEGNLLVCYHGTDADFNVFDAGYISSDNKLGYGFYFMAGKGLQYEYNHTKAAYLNITNPITDTSKMLSQSAVEAFCKKMGIVGFNYSANTDNDLDTYERLSYSYVGDTKKFLQNAIDILVVDGVLSEERSVL